MLRRHAPWSDYDDRGYFGGGYLDRGWPPPSLMEVRARWLAWLWRLALAGGFLALASYVVSHDDPRHPGLTDRSWLTLTLAAALVGLLSLHRLAGVVPLLRALAEYSVVALLVVLLGTGPGAFAPAATHPTGRPSGQASSRARAGERAATTGKQASQAGTWRTGGQSSAACLAVVAARWPARPAWCAGDVAACWCPLGAVPGTASSTTSSATTPYSARARSSGTTPARR